MKLLTRVLVVLLRARWIVSTTTGDLGFRICGFNFWYYKWPEPMVADYPWRLMHKREFGESLISNVCDGED